MIWTGFKEYVYKNIFTPWEDSYASCIYFFLAETQILQNYKGIYINLVCQQFPMHIQR